MINSPLVSIIVTTYNRSSTLKDTINSILSQTFSNFELLIIDDNSIDNTLNVVTSFKDHRIKYHQLKKNFGGPAFPRNYGISISAGSYIAFCDDDDIWKYNKLEVQVEYIRENKLDIVSSNIFVFSNKIDNIIKVSKNRLVYNIYDLLLTNQINTSTVLLKKSSFVKFSESKDFLSHGEDYLLWLKLYKNNYKFGFIEQPLVYYRIWDNNISNKNLSNINLIKIKLKYVFCKENPTVIIIIFCFISILINLMKYVIKKIFY